MKFAIAVLLGLVAANDERYLGHISKYGLSYATREEYEFRKGVFDANMDKIEAHNSDPNSTFSMGENHMTDWTDAEFNQLLGDTSPAN